MPNKTCCPNTSCKRNGICTECMTFHRDRGSLTKCQQSAKRSGIIVNKKPTETEKSIMASKPIWECGISEFEWFYDSEETCLLIEGEVTVEYDDGSVCIGANDYVTFPQGLSCFWKVVKPVKKHYAFK